ncbi:MAG: hypothetical protein PUC37_01935 [Spirochaetales bacterium]|nr:hypothetical protein [Spirochaetales bacterium]
MRDYSVEKKINKISENFIFAACQKSVDKTYQYSCNLVGYNDSKVYQITYISTNEQTYQEYYKSNVNPKMQVQTKYVKTNLTSYFYGRTKDALEKFQQANNLPGRVINEVNIEILPTDIQDLLNNSDESIIIATEEKYIFSKYLGIMGTEKSEKIPEYLKGIIKINTEGEIEGLYEVTK